MLSKWNSLASNVKRICQTIFRKIPAFFIRFSRIQLLSFNTEPTTFLGLASHIKTLQKFTKLTFGKHWAKGHRRDEDEQEHTHTQSAKCLENDLIHGFKIVSSCAWNFLFDTYDFAFVMDFLGFLCCRHHEFYILLTFQPA